MHLKKSEKKSEFAAFINLHISEASIVSFSD